MYHQQSGSSTAMWVGLALFWLVGAVYLELQTWSARRAGLRRETTVAGVIENQGLFWWGVLGCSGGALMHLPMYLSSADNGYRMVGMPWDTAMIVGMVVIVLGLAIGIHGLIPQEAGKIADRVRQTTIVRAMDDAPLSKAHVALILVLAFATTIDLMKTTTLSFVTPGVAAEYGLATAANPNGGVSVAWNGFGGITGTIIGSYVFGWLGDRIGRRASLLFASLIFIASSVCGFMPSFELNVAMCLFMGLGAGGMLPVAFSLLAETIPAKHRGWVLILVGGDVAGAIVITSWLSGALTPHFGWRILWFLGMPTALMLLAICRWLPESPRYLLGRGDVAEAERVMAKYHSAPIEASPKEGYGDGPADHPSPTRRDDAEPQPPSTNEGRHRFAILAIASVALAAGVITFGFQFWLPLNLTAAGFSVSEASYIIRDAAIYGLPLTALIAWGYGAWSSRWTTWILCTITALNVLIIAMEPVSLFTSRATAVAVLILPLTGVSSIAAVVVVHGSELAPTFARARGTGLVAAATKLGGWLMITWGLVGLATLKMGILAAVGGFLLLGTAAFALACTPETRQRRLGTIEHEVGAAIGLPKAES